MNSVYFVCHTCKTYIDAGYRWAYWSFEEPGIARPGGHIRAEAVLNAETYWAVPGGGWPTLDHLDLVRLFLVEHGAHELTYGDDETFLPNSDSEAILKWLEIGSHAEPSVRAFAANSDYRSWTDVLARHHEACLMPFWFHDKHLRVSARREFERLRSQPPGNG